MGSIINYTTIIYKIRDTINYMDYNGIKCPLCGENNMAPIIYGYPTPELVELARKDMVALGGCVVSPDNPTHYCYSCNETTQFEPKV